MDSQFNNYYKCNCSCWILWIIQSWLFCQFALYAKLMRSFLRYKLSIEHKWSYSLLVAFIKSTPSPFQAQTLSTWAPGGLPSGRASGPQSWKLPPTLFWMSILYFWFGPYFWVWNWRYFGYLSTSWDRIKFKKKSWWKFWRTVFKKFVLKNEVSLIKKPKKNYNRVHKSWFQLYLFWQTVHNWFRILKI